MNYDYLFHVFVKACKLNLSLGRITVSFSCSTQVIVIAVTKWQKSLEGKKKRWRKHFGVSNLYCFSFLQLFSLHLSEVSGSLCQMVSFNMAFSIQIQTLFKITTSKNWCHLQFPLIPPLTLTNYPIPVKFPQPTILTKTLPRRISRGSLNTLQQ